MTRVMPVRLMQYFLGFVCGLSFISCGNESVDEGYLKSDTYQQFKENTQRESAFRINNKQDLQAYLKKLITCNKGPQWAIPVQINSRTIRKNMKHEGEACEEIELSGTSRFSIQILGHSHFKEVLIQWIALNKKSVYDNQELLAVTYRDSALVGFQTVGMFRENLSKDISTSVEVTQREGSVYLFSYMNRGIKFPFEQENMAKSIFQIDSLGSIREHSAQNESSSSLKNHLEELIHCDVGKKWSLPLQINRTLVKDFGKRCNRLADKFPSNYKVQNIGHTPFKGIIIRWIGLTEKPLFENRMLLTATYQNRSLINFQTVGMFQENQSKNISTKIRVSQSDDFIYISSVVKRNSNYPIRYEDVVSSKKYQINTDGMIDKQ